MGSVASFTPCVDDEPFLAGKPKGLLKLYPAEVTFGNTVLDEDSGTHAILLTNEGYDTAVITDVIVVGDFAMTSGALNQIAAGETLTLQVKFHPTKAGAMTGGLHIVSEDAQGHKFVKLAGSGVLSPAAMPQYLQLIGSNNAAIEAVNVSAGVFGFLAEGVFDGASVKLQWRPNTATAWVDISGAILTDSDAIYGIPLTAGQVRVILAGGGSNTLLTAKLVW